MFTFLRRRTSRVVATTLLMVFACSGCLLHELNSGHYNFHLSAGLDALDAESYTAAKREFGRACWYAQTAHLGPEAEAAALYNYAIAVGHLRDFDQAEDCLKRAIGLDAKYEGVEGRHASMRLFELARLYQAWGRYAESAEHYGRAITIAEKFEAKTKEPENFSAVLDDYANVLEKVGEVPKADAVRSQAKLLRGSDSGKANKPPFRHYPQLKR